MAWKGQPYFHVWSKRWLKTVTGLLWILEKTKKTLLRRSRVVDDPRYWSALALGIKMESAGLAIGLLALASTFKDCIDLYSMFSAGRSFGRDSEILNTKLDVEKMLFLQWAERVGLARPHSYDRRLDNPEMRRMVEKILSGIRTLLDGGEVLKERYGLHSVDCSPDAAGNAPPLIDGPSSSRLVSFLKDFEKLSIRSEAHFKRPAQGISRKVRWVVSDKDKFVGLIQELSYFNSRLDALFMGKTATTFEMTQDDLKKLCGIPSLKLIIEAATAEREPVADAARDALIKRRVLQRLWFRWISDRKVSVEEPHYKTLAWALNPPPGLQEWDDLSSWLRQGSGIYWVAGKAGSGKSTLMKHLDDHAGTRQLIGEWADGAQLIRASFFFYALGSAEQKSREGLLRGLLYQILERHPDLMESVLPQMWQEAASTDDDLSMPSVAELQQALRVVAAGRKVFLLVDGLDEYEGRHADLAIFFEKLGRSADVKLLVSSRPLPTLVSMFSRKPKMNLQDLTKSDIAEYIEATISSHDYVKTLETIYPGGPEGIIRDVIAKASGVFLWVVLACRSILDGLDVGDDLPLLKIRVDELPPELEDLFRHMLAKVDLKWCEHAAKLIRLVFDNHARSDCDPIPMLGLALSDAEGLLAGACELPETGMSSARKLARCRTMDTRLRSRCCGLLEAHRPGGNDDLWICRNLAPDDDGLIHAQVVFIHRSVYEFLCNPSVWDLHALRISDLSFNSHATLCSMWIRLAQIWPYSSGGAELTGYIRNSIGQAISAQASGWPAKTAIATLSRLQLAIGGLLRELDYGWAAVVDYLTHQPRCFEYFRDHSLALAIAAELNMTEVIRFVFEQPDEAELALVQARKYLHTQPNIGACPGIAKSGCQMLHRANENIRPRGGNAAICQTVLPLLYHVLCYPMLSGCLGKTLRGLKLALAEEGNPPQSSRIETVRYLLRSSKGHSPNEPFLEAAYCPRPVTPWIVWLQRFGEKHRKSTMLALSADDVEITNLLLDAGAEIFQEGNPCFSLLFEAWSVFDSKDCLDWSPGGECVANGTLAVVRKKLGQCKAKGNLEQRLTSMVSYLPIYFDKY